MTNQQQSLEDLHHIKTMMERSSRFISLSGLSGISAGICALIGAWLAYPYVHGEKNIIIDEYVALAQVASESYTIILNTWLFWIALGTLTAALVSAFLFTYFRSRKQGLPMWSNTSRRLLLSVLVPVFAGGLFLFRLAQFGTFGLLAPGCLIFYGLGLISAGRYTLGEIRYLGFVQLFLGITAIWCSGYGLYFWAFGFGIMHIVYGIYMWMKYERNEKLVSAN
ncbi:MAG: hypothetical protein IPL97_06235 [Niastella sp.]|nr:hypothetical protein [Niastella sp.]